MIACAWASLCDKLTVSVTVKRRVPVRNTRGGARRTVTQKGGKSCPKQNPSKLHIQGERSTKEVPERKAISIQPAQHSTRSRYSVRGKEKKDENEIIEQLSLLDGSLVLVLSVWPLLLLAV